MYFLVMIRVVKMRDGSVTSYTSEYSEQSSPKKAAGIGVHPR
ncbi:hypothetical protein [Pseudacidobacterium ailaaui]|nr:hypothetical protein [Pseudacidobacterium ailaaui]